MIEDSREQVFVLRPAVGRICTAVNMVLKEAVHPKRPLLRDSGRTVVSHFRPASHYIHRLYDLTNPSLFERLEEGKNHGALVRHTKSYDHFEFIVQNMLQVGALAMGNLISGVEQHNTRLYDGSIIALEYLLATPWQPKTAMGQVREFRGLDSFLLHYNALAHEAAKLKA